MTIRLIKINIAFITITIFLLTGMLWANKPARAMIDSLNLQNVRLSGLVYPDVSDSNIIYVLREFRAATNYLTFVANNGNIYSFSVKTDEDLSLSEIFALCESKNTSGYLTQTLSSDSIIELQEFSSIEYDNNYLTSVTGSDKSGNEVSGTEFISVKYTEGADKPLLYLVYSSRNNNIRIIDGAEAEISVLEKILA